MSRLSSQFDMNLVEKMKTDEAPVFHHGALIKPRPKRHCIARRHFYYTSEEWYKPNNRLPLKTESDEKQVTKTKSTESVLPESEEYNQYTVQIPSKVYADTYIRKDASKWKSTPVPGIRVCPESDQYRQQVIDEYAKVYPKERSVLPKYGGYVPGLKFRYGSPFGQLTCNAREIGIDSQKSRTWGGAVSLF